MVHLTLMLAVGQGAQARVKQAITAMVARCWWFRPALVRVFFSINKSL